VLTLLVALTAPALADLPPPSDQKRVPYFVQVQEYDATGDTRLVVYPWSDSDGAPTAEVGVLSAKASVSFGRRIMGSPVFWAVNKDKAQGLQGLTEDELKAFFETDGNAVACSGVTISPYHTVSVGGVDRIVDVVHVVTLNATTCTLKPSAAPAQVDKVDKVAKKIDDAKPSGPCSTGPVPAAWGAMLLLLPWVRRRRSA
jgi:MYXO-CTERM domain-containing protein